MFKLSSRFQPTGDQPQAIENIVSGITHGLKNQVLLGVTGSGKTFTMANVIEKLQMPALIISHNKTLAGQLYQEMRDFFPQNAVSYFVSYYDYYQPEAYMPQTDTYIEKEAQINALIDKLRLQATTNIMTKKDVVVVASVSSIYNIGSPKDYEAHTTMVRVGEPADWLSISRRLVELQYARSEYEFVRGSFRLRGNYLDIFPAYLDFAYRIYEESGRIAKIVELDPLTGEERVDPMITDTFIIFPAKHFLTRPEVFNKAETLIRADLKKEYEALKKKGKLLEAQRLNQRVNYDLEMIREVGYVNGIENYSRYLDGRNPGDPPYSLINYFQEAYGNDFLVFIDESHMTVPQLRGMYHGDYSRKSTLIDFGFRLQAALDNRPLKFEEFYAMPPHLVYVSATPDVWEIQKAQKEVMENGFAKHSGVIEQLVRPTGIVDPNIIIKPAKNEIADLIGEIEKRVALGQKTLVTTLTKKTAEDLTEFLKEKAVRTNYLHSDVKTLERSDILDNLRKGEYDVLIGVNLLREGLDLPEVALVAILDADREGFLRSRTSLVQTMGRAARNISGTVILYADKITDSIKAAVEEIDRRRHYQEEYNRLHGIDPTQIDKPIRDKIVDQPESTASGGEYQIVKNVFIDSIVQESLTPYDKKKLIKKLESDMRSHAENLNFELAIAIRDKIRELKGETHGN